MKGIAYLAAAAVAATIAVGGTALAAERATDRDSYEFKAALETGGLPGGAGSVLAQAGSRRLGVGDTGTHIYLLDPFTGGQSASPGTAVPAIEAGGIVHRLGIDTP